ncbi:MAG: hypothetical protein OEZ34_08000 [Spirochaetia bacterium]|nr:hypothetical protein [Spirochaetia bacterium]
MKSKNIFNIRKRLLHLIILLFLLNLPSCIVIRNTMSSKKFPEGPSASDKATFSWMATPHRDTYKGGLSNRGIHKGILTAFLKAGIDADGLLTGAKIETNKVHVSFDIYGDSSPPAAYEYPFIALNMITLTIVPGFTSRKIRMRAVFSRGNQFLGSYYESFRYTTLSQLLFIFAFPSYSLGDNLTEKIILRMVHDILVEARKDKII